MWVGYFLLSISLSRKGWDCRTWVIVGLLCGVLAGTSRATQEQEPRETGVVVEEVSENSALEKAGLEAGDLLLSWKRPPNAANPEDAAGEFHSPFDWEWVKVEQAPRGTVRLSGERMGKSGVWAVEPGLWEAKVRPAFPGKWLGEYLRGEEFAAAGDLESAAAVWEQLADQEEIEPLRCWLYWHLGGDWFRQQGWEQAHAAYRSALEATRKPVAQVVIWGAIGGTYERQNDFTQSEASLRSALEIYQYTWGQSLGFALGLNYLGRVAFRRGQLVLAEEYHQQALEIRRQLAPNSLRVAYSLHNLGIVARNRGQLDIASEYYQEALEIKQKLAPNSLSVASSLDSLGIVARRQGQLDLAAEHSQRALEIKQTLAPNSLRLALSLNNLGSIAYDRGQLDLATELSQRALEIKQELAPNSLRLALSLNNLGSVVYDRGQLDKAAEYFQRALEIQQKLAPNGLNVALSLDNLGSVAYGRRQLDEAVEFFHRALEIQRKLAPNGLDMAISIHNLGTIAGLRGRLEKSEEYFHQVLAIQQTLAPGSLDLATTLNSLGLTAVKQGRLDSAKEHFDRSLDTLEAQINKLGGSQSIKGNFRTQHRRFYCDYIKFLMQTNSPEEAFATLERSRAQSFLAMLEERELIFSDISEELDQKRQGLTARHYRTLRKLAPLSASKDQEEVEELQGQLTGLYREWDELRARIRKESPNLANLQDPQSLNFAEVQMTLDPGTVMLSYSVRKEQTDIFVIDPGQDLIVHTLQIGKGVLQDEVTYFRERIDATQSGGFLGESSKIEVKKAGKRLYEWLIEPTQDLVEAADRVLLIPDGPLHRLPFAALIRKLDNTNQPTSKDWQYFIEWKPLHIALSATVFAELKKSRQDRSQENDDSPMLAAFGDPHYSLNFKQSATGERGISGVRRRSARERCGFQQSRLTASRREVLEIASLHRNVQTYLGQGAREENVKTLSNDANILHIAAHGCFDNQLPLNSGLFLTLPEGFPDDRDDGLLQAWEIFENVRLNADLVVLSACDSSLGKEQGGDGLIGLTRAFQYAGARTVAAALWSVDDQATAGLMVSFYRHLREGKTKDVALQEAQMELIQSPIEVRGEDGQVRLIDVSSPYFWAAFQILGDWM